MGDRSAHGVGSKAPEDEAPVAQETEAGGTEVKEGFETSPEEGRGGGGPDRMYFFPPLFRSLLDRKSVV